MMSQGGGDFGGGYNFLRGFIFGGSILKMHKM